MMKLTTVLLLMTALSWANVPEQPKPIVFVKVSSKTEIFDRLSFPARMLPKINASVLSETEGVVQSILTPLGTEVKKGQLLARVQHTDPVFKYAPVNVTAPVGGVVSRLEVTVGSRITKGQKILSITDPKKVRILIEVAATDLAIIHKGLEGNLILRGSKETIPVSVFGISPFVDPATATATAELRPTQKNNAVLLPGRLGRVNFKVRNHLGFQIPQEAVVYREEKTFLRLVEDNKAKLVEVKLGPTRRGIVEVLSGIKANQPIIVRSNQYIADGEEVKVETAKGSKKGKGNPAS